MNLLNLIGRRFYHGNIKSMVFVIKSVDKYYVRGYGECNNLPFADPLNRVLNALKNPGKTSYVFINNKFENTRSAYVVRRLCNLQ
jgi:hypothetical protein